VRSKKAAAGGNKYLGLLEDYSFLMLDELAPAGSTTAVGPLLPSSKQSLQVKDHTNANSHKQHTKDSDFSVFTSSAIMSTPRVLINSLKKSAWFQAPGMSDGFEWPLLIVILLIILIVAGLSILICLCMKKEADDEREYRAQDE
jgi:hypothetical protein